LERKSFIILVAVQPNELSAWKQRLWNNHTNKVLEHKGYFKNLPMVILGLLNVQSFKRGGVCLVIMIKQDGAVVDLSLTKGD
jgi:hypothetical protein